MNTFENMLFIDIETVSCAASYEEMPDWMKPLWLKKAGYLGGTTEEEKVALFVEKGGIFAEFGKIIVIALGYVVKDVQGRESLRVQGLADDDEENLLRVFKDFLSKFPRRNLRLCGHNCKEFDLPYLCRRMTVHGMPLPEVLNTQGKKPWEVLHVDTMELWTYGDRKNYTSLDLLAGLFGIPSSKEDMNGSEVNAYYYIRKNLAAIKRYCMKDVIATTQLYRRLHCLPLIAAEAIHQVTGGDPKPIAPKPTLPFLDN